MEELTDADILHVARLARLRVKPNELDAVRKDLNRVLTYVSQLQALDLEGVPPTMHVLNEKMPLRADKPVPSLTQSEAVKNGPVVEQDMFVVPRIMEGGSDSE